MKLLTPIARTRPSASSFSRHGRRPGQPNRPEAARLPVTAKVIANRATPPDAILREV